MTFVGPSRPVDFGGRLVGDRKPVMVCAEIGINHNGNPELAKRMIRESHLAGCEAVKLQRRNVDAVYSAEYLDSPRESPWGTTQREQKEGLELSSGKWRALDAYAERLGMQLTASCWDPQSVKDVASWTRCPWLKVHSPALTDYALLEAYANVGCPLVVSTGMSTEEEVREAVTLLRGVETVWLVCTSSYPAEPKDAHIARMETLREITSGAPIGLSHHGLHPEPVYAAVARGACMVEVHVTLDRQMYGSDQALSWEMGELADLVAGIRRTEASIGSPELRRLDVEEASWKKLRGK